MLQTSEVVTFLPSQDLDRSEQFFRGVLGLPLVSRTPYAHVYEAGEVTLRVTKVDDFRPQPFTVLGWLVTDLFVAVDGLLGRGIVMLRYDGLEQDDRGVWTTPSGDVIAWFHDPDSNVLSLTQHATT